MKTYRIGVLGCGNRGTHAARAYHLHPRTELVGICDLDKTRLDTLGTELGISARFTDLDKMMLDTRPDIVIIPTGTEFHYELSMRVLEYGANIDLEKPICVDLEQADALMEKARDKKAKVAVHHQFRVGTFMKAVNKEISQGRIGHPSYIYSTGKGYYGGYGLMNIGTHLLSYVIKFAGHCRKVSALATTDGHPVTPDDVVLSPHGMGTITGEYITATLQFDNNIASTLRLHRFPKIIGRGSTMEIYGTEGRILWSADGAWLLPEPNYLPGNQEVVWEPLEPIFPEHYDPLSNADANEYWFVEEYVNALDENRDHECSGAVGHHVLEIMMGIFESAAFGKTIDLPQKHRDHPLLRWRQASGYNFSDPVPRNPAQWLKAEDRRLGR